jgi:hypothetical protein
MQTNLFFNKHNNNLTPKYADIKVPGTSETAYFTRKKARITRIKDEIKFLYKKKDQYLEVAQQLGNTWAIIHNSIHENINQGTERKYNTMKRKLNRLEQTQTNMSKHYPRVVNNTSIQFTSEELNLLNQGLKYNLNYKNKNWIQTLAFETETAIAQLPNHEQEEIRYRVAHNTKQLYKQQSHNKQHNSNRDKKERHTLSQIKNKLATNK